MVDTVRTLAALQTLLADNAAGDISPQDLRDMLVSQAVPQWVQYLHHRLDETANTDDDEFDDASIDGAWTSLLVSGTAVWTEGKGVLSVVFKNQSAGDAAAQIKSINGSPSSPIQITTAVRGMSTEDHGITGVFFSDGTVAGSNVVLARYNHADRGIGLTQGTFTDFQNSILWSRTLFTGHSATWVYLRLTWVSANTWRLETSPDAVSWTAFDNTDKSDTMTPTHYGVLVGAFAGVVEKISTFEYFRSDAP